ncbi:hypothetical protein Tco_1322926, partial [Tanacetum coccineum]
KAKSYPILSGVINLVCICNGEELSQICVWLLTTSKHGQDCYEVRLDLEVAYSPISRSWIDNRRGILEVPWSVVGIYGGDSAPLVSSSDISVKSSFKPAKSRLVENVLTAFLLNLALLSTSGS